MYNGFGLPEGNAYIAYESAQDAKRAICELEDIGINGMISKLPLLTTPLTLPGRPILVILDIPFFKQEDGDLRVVLKRENKDVKLTVSSKALCLASPVWKKLIFPPFEKLPSKESVDIEREQAQEQPRSKKVRQSDDFDDWEIHFTDDDYSALTLLFEISHLQFKNIPPRLPYGNLLKVAILCDQYDCVALVQPWLSQWLTDEEIESQMPGQEQWIFISWVFGKEKVFVDLARKLAYRVGVNSSGDRVAPYINKNVDFPEPTPPGILGKFETPSSPTVKKRIFRVLAN